jgi:hypothetical protein
LLLEKPLEHACSDLFFENCQSKKSDLTGQVQAASISKEVDTNQFEGSGPGIYLLGREVPAHGMLLPCKVYFEGGMVKVVSFSFGVRSQHLDCHFTATFCEVCICFIDSRGGVVTA